MKKSTEISKEERERLEALRAENHENSTFAKNYVALAQALGVSRQSLYAWKNLPDAPVPAPNGQHRILEWRRFIRENGLNATAELGNAHGDSLRARKLLAEIEERELKVAIRKGEYILAEDVRTQISALASGAVSILRAKFENELPPLIAGKSAVEIREICSRVIDEVSSAISKYSPPPKKKTQKKSAAAKSKKSVKHQKNIS